MSKQNQREVNRESLDELGSASLAMMAERGWLRLRAFGATSIYGQGAPFHGKRRKKASETLLRSIQNGFMALYRDGDGYFVGPADPSEIEPVSKSKRGAVQ